MGSVLFSAVIWLEFFDISNKLIHTVFAILAFGVFLKLPKGSGFWFGFFVGIFWFWGVSLSFAYYDLHWMMPFVILGFGLAYGAFFYFADAYKSPIYKALFLFAFSFFEPFGFNWLKPELLLVDSFFDVDKAYFAIIIFGLAFAMYFKKYYYLALLAVALDFGISPIFDNNLEIEMPQLNVLQEQKWNEKYKGIIYNNNIALIDKAIKSKRDLIVFPETAFDQVINFEPQIQEILKQKSYKIPIIAGALFFDGTNMFNSTYFFKDGTMTVAHKTILVPFGEAVPLPGIIKNIINGVFFDGAKDFLTAKKPTDFEIKGTSYRNAICYEATKDELFEGDPKYMIALSNMAWFTPSTLPALQNLLLKYYSKKYETKIYHSVNMGENRIFEPK